MANSMYEAITSGRLLKFPQSKKIMEGYIMRHRYACAHLGISDRVFIEDIVDDGWVLCDVCGKKAPLCRCNNG